MAQDNAVHIMNIDGVPTLFDIHGNSLGAVSNMLGSPFFLNRRTLTEDVTIPAGYSAVVVGPFTVEDGATLTIEDDAALGVL